MFVAAVLCLGAAVVTAALGLWLLSRPQSEDPVREVLRSVAPTQLAAAAMLAAGGAVALAADSRTALFVVAICVLGALGTVGAGCWQSAKSVARREAAPATGGCAGGACATCTLSCS
ncbi:hypothetical protein H7J88_21910 [Mycolicibacterium flavescens]|uniref:Transmembrane protein n=1 Tax=Mycolicibacterium flavescens TaxID=1776 RepID=A0A1E3RJ31_MYCFV|nr:hypothetical protein [Mycolicibacterium flavescens]MCV7282291.1 hypothetical protein [Mycolicibacterium flavescens]ODQ89472.1 hypothetical protein BHQ18_13640 [Mycolicibacterium flavescens]